MDVYIDKANLLSFIKSNNDSLFVDCNKLLKKQMNVFFNFPKEELKMDHSLMIWITTLSQGMGKENQIKFNYNIPTRPLKSNSSNGFCVNKLSSVFLVDDGRDS